MEDIMCKIILFFILFSLYVFSQPLPIEENFDYSTGVLISSSDWEESNTGTKAIQVVSGSLSYTGYPSSSIGNKIFVDGGADGRSGNAKIYFTIRRRQCDLCFFLMRGFYRGY